MKDEKLIQWPKAAYWSRTFNPWIGCKKVSPACDNCYARAIMRRFCPNTSSTQLLRANALENSFTPRQSAQRRPPKSGVVFCGNMTDLWGDWVPLPEAYVVRTSQCKKGVYLYLTKRFDRMCKGMKNIPADIYEHYLSNHYFGFTAENQEWYEKRLKLREVSDFSWPDWANLWVSCEPLLGPIDLGLMFAGEVVKPKYSWVVVGAESGPKRRECKIEWIESIVEQCKSAGVPVFVKQICLPSRRFTNKIDEFPEHLRIRQVPWARETT